MGFDVSEVDHLAADFAAAPAVVAVGSAVVVGNSVQQIARDAQDLAPELTGDLRAKIRGESQGLSGSVVSESDHAAYVEYGTSDTAPQPHMRPAADRNEPRFAEGLLGVVTGALR